MCIFASIQRFPHLLTPMEAGGGASGNCNEVIVGERNVFWVCRVWKKRLRAR